MNSFEPTAPGAGSSGMFSTRTTGMERFPTFPAQSDWTFSRTAGHLPSADFDQDGRQEVFLKNRNAPQLRLLKNVSGESAAVDRFPPSRHEE
jgi:hypothetical protein